MSIGVSGVNHLIGHIFMMQMDSSISGIDSGSRAHFRSESFQRFIYFKEFTLCPRVHRLIVSIGVSGVIHLIGHIFMMQMDSFNFGF